MVSQELIDSSNLVHIIFFVYLNVLYVYMAIRLWKRKIDAVSKLVLLLYYLVFFVAFLLAVFENT